MTKDETVQKYSDLQAQVEDLTAQRADVTESEGEGFTTEIERLNEDCRIHLMKRHKAEAEVARLRETVARVEALHRPDGGIGGPGAMCVTCTRDFGTPAEDPVAWPCLTALALKPATDEGADQ